MTAANETIFSYEKQFTDTKMAAAQLRNRGQLHQLISYKTT